MKSVMKLAVVVGAVLLGTACTDEPTRPYTINFKNGKLDTMFLQQTDTVIKTITDTINNVIVRTDTIRITNTKTDTVVRVVNRTDTLRLVRVDTVTRNIMKTDTLRLVRVDTIFVPRIITRVDTLRLTQVDTVFVPRVIVRVDTVTLYCTAVNNSGNLNCSNKKP